VLCMVPALLVGQVSAPKASVDEAASHTLQDQALRDLVTQYYAAYAKKDVDALMALWSSRSPDLAARRLSVQQFFAANDKITVNGLTFEDTKVDGDKARQRLQVEISATDIKTGKQSPESGKSIRILECVRESGNWKVWREADAVEELASLLIATKSEQERSTLLFRDGELVNPALVTALIRRANGLRERGEYEITLPVLETAQGIATTISDRLGMARVLEGIGQVT